MSFFIMKNTFCRHLKLPLELDSSGLKKIQESYKDINSYFVFDIDVDPNIVNYLKTNFNVDVTHGEVFYTPPKGRLPIHIDVYGDEITKMNWVFGATDSEMVWYKIKDPNKPLNKQLTPIGTPYVLYEIDDCDKIYSDRINKPSIINAAIPHDVINNTDIGRWCISYVLLDFSNAEKLKWEDAVKRFGSVIQP
jgi:hypothetical protein